MIQSGTYVNIVDNSGAKKIKCIKVNGGYRKRYATIGDIIIGSVKEIHKKKNTKNKIKSGEIVRILIFRCKTFLNQKNGGKQQYMENSGIVINRQNKLIGTRIFGSGVSVFRKTKFLKILSICSGISH